MGTLKQLPTLGPAVADALDTIKAFQDRLASVTTEFNGFLSQIRDDGATLFPNGKYDLFHLVYSDALKNSSINLIILGRVSQAVTDLDTLTERLKIGVRTIDEQDVVVTDGIKKIEARSTQIALGIVSGLFALAIAFALFFTGGSSNRSRTLNKTSFSWVLAT